MFIRHKPNKPKRIKPLIQEVVPQEQPLEEPIDVAEVAAQKVEEVMNMAPVGLVVEDAIAFLDQACEEECAEEPVEPIGEIEPAQDLDEVSSSDEGDTTE